MADSSTRNTERLATDWGKICLDFPMLKTTQDGKPLAYLDNAATTLKPIQVIERVKHFDTYEYATVRRGAYRLSERATGLLEDTRESVAKFIGANIKDEIIFTSGATHSINMAAYSYGRKFIKNGDEIIISHMEHHANIVPWQVLCEEKGARLKIIPVNDSGELLFDEYRNLLTSRTKIVAITHVSNALGTVNPVKDIVDEAHNSGAVVLVDGAQSTPHMRIDVDEIGCDFFVFSAHKMYGPTGIGVLYGKREILDTMPPYMTGGDMINEVTMEKTTYARPPARFEAGTPPITQIIGLGEAIAYIESIGVDNISNYEKKLLDYGTQQLTQIPEVKIIGTAKSKAGIISFSVKDVHPHDMVTMLDENGIAVRGGHHCAQPIMDRFNVPATTRASLAFYNKFEELDCLARAVKNTIKLFS